MFKKKQRSATVVGLDLDPSHIAAAEVHANGSVSVKKGAVAALRPGVLRDGEASDPVALAEALRELFDANDLPRARAPRHRQPADRRALARPAGDRGPEGPRRRGPAPRRPTTSRCRWTRRSSTSSRSAWSRPPAGPRSRVVIVAVRREMIERLVVRHPRAPGCELEGIDLAAFGMVRALAPAARRAGDPLHQRRRPHERRGRQRLGVPVHPRGRRRARRRRAQRSPSAAASRRSTRASGCSTWAC